MRPTKTKNTLDFGDMVELRGTAYLVMEKIKGRSCAPQCHLYDHINDRCPGTCLRWENGDEVVFRRILPTEIVRDDIPFVVTDTWERLAEMVAERNKEMHYLANLESRGKRGPKPGHGGRPSSGSVSYDKTHDRYKATVQVNGVKYYKTSRDEGVVEAWLEAKRKELGIDVKGGGNV